MVGVGITEIWDVPLLCGQRVATVFAYQSENFPNLSQANLISDQVDHLVFLRRTHHGRLSRVILHISSAGGKKRWNLLPSCWMVKFSSQASGLDEGI